MKRFLAFGGDQYYPSGGWADFQGSFDTKDEALVALIAIGSIDWWEVIDSSAAPGKRIVAAGARYGQANDKDDRPA